MSETYLPIKESLGYQNVKTALWNVFEINLDTILIREGKEYENFGFSFSYNNYEMTMLLSSTEKKAQFNFGEGRMFDILFPNPKYPEHSFLEETFFYNFIQNKEVKGSVENIFGRKERDIEHAMRILKDFLDSDEAKVLWKNE